MRVYIITSGEYSDYEIEHVTLDKEKAERYCAVLNGKSRYEDYRVEEYKLDDFEVSENLEIKWRVNVRIYNPYGLNAKAEIRDIFKVSADAKDDIVVRADYAYVPVLMKKLDEDKACKIALDRLAKWKAEQLEKENAVLSGYSRLSKTKKG